MGFKRFSLMIAVRTFLIMLTLISLAFLIAQKGYLVSTIVVVMLLAAQSILLFRFVNKTNSELVRFFEAARYADYSQRFEFKEIGAGFAELGKTFTDILKTFQQNRTVQEEEYRHLKALIEHVPVPLISLHADGKISLWNNSARRLFGANKTTKVDDLIQYGKIFHEQLIALESGERKLVQFEVDGMQHQLVVLATQIIVAGRQEKLLSLQDIQAELDDVQLQSWQDLVRVLTHEIMNSITPVASLAKTASDLLDDLKNDIKFNNNAADELDDVYDAIHTVAKRSDGLMKFVSSYRQLTRLPAPNKTRIDVADLMSSLTRMTQSNLSEQEIALTININPLELNFMADVDMVEQVLINLINNAIHALQETPKAKIIKVDAYLNRRGHPVIDTSDNGPGISDEIANKIFVPFFTTKRQGSGVGLALTRQVMLAHNGNVKLYPAEIGGACFRLTF